MKLLFDVTTTVRSAFDPPVGTTRVERTILADLHRILGDDGMTCVNFDEGRFVRLDPAEMAVLHALIDSPTQQAQRPERRSPDTPVALSPMTRSLTRRVGRRLIELYPEPYREQARQAAVQGYLAMQSTARVSWSALRSVRRRGVKLRSYTPLSHAKAQVFDFSGHTDLITIGNGWDYLDYENLYDLKRRHGLRVHGFVHDLIVIDRPYLFYDFRKASAIHRHYAELCNLCETLICNSYATRDALEAFIATEGLPKPKISVAQLPVFEERQLPAARPAGIGDEPFILYVSTIEARKNHRLLLNIWRECLLEKRDMPKLILVGRVGWGVEPLMNMIEGDPVLRDRVVLLHDIGDGELAWLYDHCLFTVYPSLIEGWGLPIGEALGRGRICLHATDPAQKEASQGLMPALHPEDFYGWKSAILDLIERPARRARLEESARNDFKGIARTQFCAAVREAIGL